MRILRMFPEIDWKFLWKLWSNVATWGRSPASTINDNKEPQKQNYAAQKGKVSSEKGRSPTRGLSEVELRESGWLPENEALTGTLEHVNRHSLTFLLDRPSCPITVKAIASSRGTVSWSCKREGSTLGDQGLARSYAPLIKWKSEEGIPKVGVCMLLFCFICTSHAVSSRPGSSCLLQLHLFMWSVFHRTSRASFVFFS